MSEFSAALLAGGRSRRMGTDKAFLEWRGRPLWEHQLEKLRALKPAQLLLSCRADQAFPQISDVLAVHDEKADCGPLGGLTACLHACETPLLVVLGVDLPQLPGVLLRSLIKQSTESCGAVVLREDHFEPLAAVYPRELLPLAKQQLAAGRLAMQEFIRRAIEQRMMRSADVPTETGWFANWNAPEDVR